QARTLEDLSERPRVIPLAEAAAAAFPRLDLTADDARRLAHGVRIPAPPPGTRIPAPAHGTPTPDLARGAATPDLARGAATPDLARGAATPDQARGAATPDQAHAAGTHETPMAAFAPDGTLVALVTEDSGSLRALAVFAAPNPVQASDLQ